MVFFRKMSKTNYFKLFLVFSNPFGARIVLFEARREFLGASRKSFLPIGSRPELEESSSELEMRRSVLEEISSKPRGSHFHRLNAARSSKRVNRCEEYVDKSSERVPRSSKHVARSLKRVLMSMKQIPRSPEHNTRRRLLNVRITQRNDKSLQNYTLNRKKIF